MELSEIIDNYIDSLILYDKAKNNDSELDINFLRDEKNKLLNLYIDRIYQIDTNELNDLREYLVYKISDLHNQIKEYMQYRNNLVNYVINNNNMYIDRLNEVNEILSILVNKVAKYKNIKIGLDDLITIKKYIKKK